MKHFNGPRKQGGWVALAAMAVSAAYSSYDQNKQRNRAAQDQKDLSREGFARQAWLDQQQRRYALEDRKYREDAMGGFRNAGPFTEKDFPGYTAPTPTTTTGLADWNPENGVPNLPLMGRRYG